MQGKVSPEPATTVPVYVGIDVCKEWLDVHVHPRGLSLRVANDGSGLRQLKRALAGLGVTCVVMEATSKYHRAAQRSLHAAGLCVAIVNPLRARLFAEACGRLAKTDRIDAALLALMAAALGPAQTPPLTPTTEALQELVGARSAANAELTALTNRLASVEGAFLRGELKRRMAMLRRHLIASTPRSSARSPPIPSRPDAMPS